jgi:predicted transcriptional regulator
VEAVIVPDDDEKMVDALNLFKHLRIHRLVTQRASKKQKTTVPLEALLKEQEALKRFQPQHP